jgi:O-antigen/teichoic acid export membrane protein
VRPYKAIRSLFFKLILPRETTGGSADDRAKERYRRAALTGITSAATRAVQVGTSLITVPLTIHYLGKERFGLWMTISSVLAIMRFADFGVGNGVLNAVSKADGAGDLAAIRSAVSSGFCLLGGVALLLFSIFMSIYHFVRWDSIFKVHSSIARAEAGPALLVFVACFALSLPLDIVQRVQLGLQQGFNTNLWQLGGAVLGLAGVLVGIHFRVSLQLLLLALAGAPVLAALLNGIVFFGFLRRDLRPRRRSVSKSAAYQIAHLGSLFFVLQAAGAIAFSADNFILARIFGAAAVPDYAIPQRMFALVSTMVAMFALPLWPAYGEASSRGDMEWVRKTVKHSLLVVLLISSGGVILLLLFARKLILLWAGPSIHSSTPLLLGLAVWTVMDCCGTVLGMFLNGLGFMRFQAIMASAFAAGCITLKIILAMHYGEAGVPWATIISYALLTGIPCAIAVPRFMKKIRNTRIPEPSVRIEPEVESNVFF